MAQNALTVTPPNPTPPTNMSCTGATPPNPPNYTKNTYADWADNTKFDSAPPPFYDDGAAGPLTAFAANTAALASGSGATAGGTEGSYPGATNGVVPASGSVAHEGAGTEVVVTASVPNPSPNGQLQTVSCLGAYTRTPNGDHASSLSPSTNPALASIAPTTAVSGPSGTDTITFTGTNFTKQSVVWVNHVAIAGAVPRAVPTTFVSPTSLTAAVPKRPTAAPASTLLWVVTGGVVETGTKLLAYT